MPGKDFRVVVVGLVLFALALIGFSTSGASAAKASKARPPVALIVMDEFPTVTLMNKSGGISASRFPNFHRLSQEGVWYRNHTSVAALTRHSVPGILSGKNVAPNDPFAITANYPVNAFSQLNAIGYKVDALESATQICPFSICPIPAKRRVDPTKFATAAEFQNAKVKSAWGPTRDNLLAWARNQKFKPKSFMFRHLLTPHHPYDHVPSGKKYKSGPIPVPFSKDDPTATSPVGNVRLSFQRLMLQVGYADRIIGEIRKAAQRQGVWKSMMLVVVGDHGLSHHPTRPFRTFQPDTSGSVAFTPLFIKYPGKLKGGISNLPTRGIDVFPTMANVLGAAAPAVDGEAVSKMAPEMRDVVMDGQSVPFNVAEQNRREAVVYRDQLLGNGGLFKMGVATALIGRKASGKPNSKARVDTPSQYRSIDPKSGTLPAMITGVAPTVPAGGVVAVSVNGVIRGTGEVFVDAGKRRFGAMVNPKFFKKKNEIGIHLVKSGRLGQRLR